MTSPLDPPLQILFVTRHCANTLHLLWEANSLLVVKDTNKVHVTHISSVLFIKLQEIKDNEQT